MLWIILLIILLLLLVGSAPVYPYSRGWGYGPGGLLLIIVVVLALLLLTGVIDIRTDNKDNGADVDVTIGSKVLTYPIERIDV